MKQAKDVKELVKKVLRERLGVRMMDGYDGYIDKKDDIKKVIAEVLDVVGNGGGVVNVLDELIKKDEDVKYWINLAKSYGGLK